MLKILFVFLLLISISPIKADDNYIPIAGSNVNVRKEPNLNSPVITQLEIGHIVKILPKKRIKDTINNIDGFWIYVETGYSTDKNPMSGWVFDYYLATPDKFKRPPLWQYKEFKGCSGDYCLSLKMKQNATYTYSYELCADGNCSNQSSCHNKSEKKNKQIGYILCEGYGIIKTYRNLIWLQHFGRETYEYLFIKEDKLCMTGMEECID